MIRLVDRGRWHVDAATDVDDLEAETGVALPDGDWNTVGGLVIGVAGRIPGIGEVFTFDGLTLTIRDAAPQRVGSVEAVLVDQPPSS